MVTKFGEGDFVVTVPPTLVDMAVWDKDICDRITTYADTI